MVISFPWIEGISSLMEVPEEPASINCIDLNLAKTTKIDIGNGSEVIYIPNFLPSDCSWKLFECLNKQIPWIRPTIRVFGRSCIQPRDTCYVSDSGLPKLMYSGYQPQPYSWEDFPFLKEILEAVHKVLPGSTFNSLLLNRYKDGNDYVGWHSDDEKLYGLTPEIVSLSLGCEREFLLRKKPKKSCTGLTCEENEGGNKKRKRTEEKHAFRLKNGSLLVMKGNTQRDWVHSVPKRAKAASTRINLTFRNVVLQC